MNENFQTSGNVLSDMATANGALAAEVSDSNGSPSPENHSNDELDQRFVAPNFVGTSQGSSSSSSKSRERKSMFCFECNRQEGHFIVEGNRWVYSFLIGLTFGLIYFIGPYTCQCCGAQRLFRSDRAHPGYWLNSLKYRSKGKSKSRRKRSESRSERRR